MGPRGAGVPARRTGQGEGRVGRLGLGCRFVIRATCSGGGHAPLSRGLSAPRAFRVPSPGQARGMARRAAQPVLSARVRSCLRTRGAARRATRMAFALRAHLRRSPAPPVRRRLGVGPRFAGGIRASLSASSSQPAHSGQTGGAPTPPGSAAAWPRARAPHSRWRDFPGPRPRKLRRRISGVRSSGCPTCTTPHEAPLGGQVRGI